MIIDVDQPFTGFVSLLTKNDVEAIGRYYCDNLKSYKLIGGDEARELAPHVRVVAIFEPEVRDLTKGTYHGQQALKCAANIGQPDKTPIYFAIEKDGGFTQGDMGAVAQYFRDITAAINGKFEIGIYSNGTPCQALRGNLAKYTWLAAASYTHDGTKAYFNSGLWTLIQMGPTDIPAWLLPAWQMAGQPHWTIDLNFANGDIGSFVPNPPAVPPFTS